jgi:hypothetical protein
MSAPKPTLYETKLTAKHNVRLMLVRRINDTTAYCIGKNKQGKPKPDFNGPYFMNELKRIQ